MIERIRKRNGQIVEFDRIRIQNAISKAFFATNNKPEEMAASSITDDVVGALELVDKGGILSVENIQDIVEQKIAAHGYFEVSKAYILYRKDHEKYRNEKRDILIKQLERGDINVISRSGVSKPFKSAEIEKFIHNSCRGKEKLVQVEEIIQETKSFMYDGISTKDINQAVIMVLRSRIESDMAYSFIAAKVLLNDLYKDILGICDFDNGFVNIYRECFINTIQRGIDSNLYDKKILEFDLKILSEALMPSRDGLLKYLGLQTLYDRYLIKDLDQNILETPQYFWMRVAIGLSLNEKNKEKSAMEFYNAMSTLHYIPSTPTLFHSGTLHPQMSSCYLLTCNDELNNIFKTMGDVAQLAKWSGGIGIDWTSIRATGALIKSTNVNSQGVVPFLKILDSTTAAINRSGKRRGATCAYLEAWHYDFEDFLELKKNTGDERRRTHELNTAAWIPDLFIRRVMSGDVWTLFSPDETPDLHQLYGKEFDEKYKEYEQSARSGKIRLFKEIPAQKLWRKMITMLYETGHPWITFKDPCNIRSPQDHVGVVNNSNLCTEITLNTSDDETAVCNLGSINLSVHVKKGTIDKSLLADTVKTAVRMLDNTIDLNFYPTPESKNSNLRHRPVGLGIMGLQDMMYKLDLSFDTNNAVRVTDEILEEISYHAISTSSKLAQEKGVYPTYKGSKWDRNIFPIDSLKLLEEIRGESTELNLDERLDWPEVRARVKQYGVRNSNLLAIAPTATIANIAGCFPSIEPIYKNLYVKSNVSGEFTILNDYLIEDLKKYGLWDSELLEELSRQDGSIGEIEQIPKSLKDKYKGAFEIDPKWLILHAAHRSKWIDQSQSLNIFTDTVSGETLSNIYLDAWKKGLKTTYYLRSLGASGVEKSTVASQKNPAPLSVNDIAPNASCSLDEGCESCQ